MKTEKCQEMMNRLLTGDRSAEVTAHLAECAACRELAELERLTAAKPEPLPVPESLDRAVLAYASAKKRSAVREFRFIDFVRHAGIPIAAGLMICFSLTFAFREPIQKKEQVGRHTDKINVQYFDTVDSELMLVSSRIEDAAAQLSRTVAFAALDEGNGMF